MEPCNDGGRVLGGSHVVELHVSFARRGLRCTHNLSRSLAGSNLPLEQLVRIADGRRQSHALDVAAREPHDAFQDREQVPPAIVSRERVHFVDDNRLNAAEQRLVFDARRHQHHFERFRRREKHVRRICENGAPRRIAALLHEDSAVGRFGPHFS